MTVASKHCERRRQRGSTPPSTSSYAFVWVLVDNAKRKRAIGAPQEHHHFLVKLGDAHREGAACDVTAHHRGPGRLRRGHVARTFEHGADQDSGEHAHRPKLELNGSGGRRADRQPVIRTAVCRGVLYEAVTEGDGQHQRDVPALHRLALCGIVVVGEHASQAWRRAWRWRYGGPLA